MFIAGVASGFLFFSNAIDDSVRALEKQADKSSQLISALELYGQTLDDLEEKHSKEQDMSRQYLNTLRHLIEVYPELKHELDLTIDAHERNAEAIKKVLGKKIQEDIDKNIKLIIEYRKQAKEAAFWSGVWAESMRLLKEAFDRMKGD